MNVNLILNALIAIHVLRTSVKTHVEHPTIHVENELNAELFIIVLYVNVLLNGLAIHMFNASNVSCHGYDRLKIYLKT